MYNSEPLSELSLDTFNDFLQPGLDTTTYQLALDTNIYQPRTNTTNISSSAARAEMSSGTVSFRKYRYWDGTKDDPGAIWPRPPAGCDMRTLDSMPYQLFTGMVSRDNMPAAGVHLSCNAIVDSSRCGKAVASPRKS